MGGKQIRKKCATSKTRICRKKSVSFHNSSLIHSSSNNCLAFHTHFSSPSGRFGSWGAEILIFSFLFSFDFSIFMFYCIYIVCLYFLLQNSIPSPWILSKKLRLEILFKMVQFSFQNSLMAPSYDPNTVLVHPPLKSVNISVGVKSISIYWAWR